VFEALRPPVEDEILVLMQMFRDDPRADKIDLGVGVYRDASGRTPVMRAVKAAEARLWESEATKSYTGLAGEADYREALARLILGDATPRDRIASVATPGGTGALHQGLSLIRRAAPQATVWLPQPSWPNHLLILQHLGLPVARFRYYDPATGGVDAGAMLADLAQIRSGDVVLLHGCCHNPTGADPSLSDWAAIARLLADRGAMPLIDLAYQGFGAGIEADAAPTRAIAAACPEVLIAASCSKSFGLYRERTGLLLALSAPLRRAAVMANMTALNLVTYSFPPDHGARLVSMILTDDSLRADWMAELDTARQRVVALRRALADELRRLAGSDRWSFLTRHNGMFSQLGITAAEVARLRTERGIYVIGDSRINIAGLHPETVPVVARAIADLVA
jgi:aromatic-amino-acid transaminase